MTSPPADNRRPFAALLLELQYLPPIQYFVWLQRYAIVYIEQQEHYIKGSYRNRCHIAGANGMLRLSIPLQKGKNEQQPIRQTRIAYNQPWQTQHWESIRSAYGSAPFFLYYADALAPLYQQRFDFLFDWNLALLHTILPLLDIHCTIHFTDAYYPIASPAWHDLRNTISPKQHRAQPDAYFRPVPYPQVFEAKYPFLPNLSILDLLCCTGPEAPLLLQQSYAAIE